MYVNNSWGGALTDEFAKHFERSGGTISTVEACKEGDRDFRTQISKMKGSNPDAFLALTYGKEGGAFVRQAKELGVSVPLFGGDVWGSPEFVKTGGSAAEGSLFTVPAPPSGKGYDNFAEAFRRKYAKEPEVYAAYSYDLTMIIAEAMQANNLDGPSIKRYLEDMPPYNGVTGLTQFDEHHDVTTKTFARRVIRNGRGVDVSEE